MMPTDFITTVPIKGKRSSAEINANMGFAVARSRLICRLLGTRWVLFQLQTWHGVRKITNVTACPTEQLQACFLFYFSAFFKVYNRWTASPGFDLERGWLINPSCATLGNNFYVQCLLWCQVWLKGWTSGLRLLPWWPNPLSTVCMTTSAVCLKAVNNFSSLCVDNISFQLWNIFVIMHLCFSKKVLTFFGGKKILFSCPEFDKKTPNPKYLCINYGPRTLGN